MLYAIVVLLILISDQAVKLWTSQSIPLNGTPRDFIPGFIQITNIHNSGAAFGILKNAGARWFFILLAVAFVALVVWLLRENVIKGKFGRWMLIMVMAGGVGNCLDRIVSGYVVDMFSFTFWKKFPVFNVADIFISVCGVLFCLYLLRNRDDLSDKSLAEAVPRAPSRSHREEPDPMADRIDYISQLSRPVVEGRKNIEAEKYAREFEKREPELGVGPGDWVNAPETAAALQDPAEALSSEELSKALKTVPETDSPTAKEEVNPFEEEVPASQPAEKPETASPKPEAAPKPDLSAGAAPASPQKDKGEGEYSLDDIIAEFKDK